MDTHETRVQRALSEAAPLEVFRRLIAENDALIRGVQLDNGREIAAARSAIYTTLVAAWAVRQHADRGYQRPFAVVALGGTGRAEMTPRSDNDFAFLFDDALEGNRFLIGLQDQILNTDEFEDAHGFACQALPFSLEEVPRLTDKQLNAFLDMRPVYDPVGLAQAFRERIRSTFDPFEHFLHVRGFWRNQWEKAVDESESLERFDIKNEGLRVFLAGIWTLAGEGFRHSHDIYAQLQDPRDLEAYGFLLRIRAFVHSRRQGRSRPLGGGNHAEDILSFDDFTSFGELLGPGASDRARHEFANEVRARLLAARRRVACFAKGVISRALRDGRCVHPGSPIVYGVGGLFHRGTPEGATDLEKSRAALGLLLASQRYEVPIDPTEWQGTFRNAGDWLRRVPELSALFYERRGSLAESFAFLSHFAGAEDRLFPGYAKFEASLDRRVVKERKTLRSALERRKLRALEEFLERGNARLKGSFSRTPLMDLPPGELIAVEAALLDADQLAAVRLALKTKRLPVTADDRSVHADENRPLLERLSTGMSGIPLEAYYAPYGAECEFTSETLRIVTFLLNHRRRFEEYAASGINDELRVREFADLCGDEARLRALFVFTGADRAEWESPDHEPQRWFNSKELYVKALRCYRPGFDPLETLRASGYAPEQLAILEDFGEDFFTGVYRQHANRFSSDLLRLAAQEPGAEPRVDLLRDGPCVIVGVAARDYRGLAATLSGALWHQGISLRQAHLFSAMNYRLALDFFHVMPSEKPLGTEQMRAVRAAIREQRYISEADEPALPSLVGTVALRGWRPGLYHLRFETAAEGDGLVYAVSYKVFRHLRGNIFALTAHAARGRAFISVYHTLPSDLTLEQAQAIAAATFVTEHAPAAT